MKKYYFYLILLLLISNQVFSQWELLKSVGENQFIKNVEVENEKIVISISDNIYLTTNFGEKWIHLNENTDKHFDLKLNTFNVSFYKNNVFLISNSNEDPGIFSTDVNFVNWKLNSKGIPLLSPSKLKLFSNESGVYIYSSYYQNLWKYNDEEKIWQIPYDTNGLKKFTIHSFYIDSNYYYFGTGYIPESIPKTGCRTPNFFKIDKKTGKLYSILDSNSDICRYYILSLNKKDGMLLAGTSRGFYISSNEGDNWLKTESNFVYEDSIYKADYIYQKILVKDDYIYALITENTQYGDFQDGYYATLIYSTDNGKKWQLPNYNLLFPDSYGKKLNVRDFEFYKSGLLLATSEGLYYINKELTQIQEINTKNLSGETVFNLHYNNGKLFALVGWRTPTTGLWTSTDNGNTWKFEQNELYGKYMSSIDVKDNLIITGSNYSGYPWLSTDFGKSFTEIKSGIFEQNNIILSTKIIDDIIYVGTTKGVICSKDRGLTWFKLSNALDKYFIYDILKINNYIIIATKNKILRSNDDAKTWEEINFQKDNKLSYYFEKLTLCDKSIYAICTIYEENGMYITPIRGTIIATSDSGKTWFEVNKGLPNYDGVSSFCCYNNHKFISSNTSFGVLYDDTFNPNFIFWRPINYGLTNRSITKLIHDCRYLYAATASGIYRVSLSDFGITDMDDSQINVKPDYLWASVAYPNPAKDFVQAKVWWDTHNDIEKAEIVVYDVYGNRVSGREKVTIIPENDYSGLIRWDCSSVPSGVYILTIQHGTRKQTVRLIKN